MSAKPKLFAVQRENKSSQQLAKEAVAEYRDRVGERFDHRGWPEDVTLAFMKADVIKGARLTQAFIDHG